MSSHSIPAKTNLGHTYVSTCSLEANIKETLSSYFWETKWYWTEIRLLSGNLRYFGKLLNLCYKRIKRSFIFNSEQQTVDSTTCTSRISLDIYAACSSSGTSPEGHRDSQRPVSTVRSYGTSIVSHHSQSGESSRENKENWYRQEPWLVPGFDDEKNQEWRSKELLCLFTMSLSIKAQAQKSEGCFFYWLLFL